MKKAILFVAIFILSILTVSAADYNLEINPDSVGIFAEESAEFEITITNPLTTIQNFRLYSNEVEWEISEAEVKVYPEDSISQKIVVTPTKYVRPGMYGVLLNVKDLATDEVKEELLYVQVKMPGQAVSEYLPSVKMYYDMDEEIDPENEVIIKIRLENHNVLNLTDLSIKISSDLEIFNTQQPVQLKPLETKDVELRYTLDPLQAPGEYKINFELLKNDKLIDVPEPKLIYIGTKELGFGEDINKKTVFFKTVTQAVYTSKSNVKDTQTIKIPVSWIDGLFTETDPGSTVLKEDENRYLVIDLELEPGESKTITVTTNYRIIIYIIIFIALIAGLFYITKSPVNIRKGISEVKTEEGGISSIKIMIQVTSIVNKPIKNVTVVDNIPSIAELQKEFIPGTLKPTKILKHEKKGTVLKWELGELGPREDRLISYSIQSKLSILGGFKLPRGKLLIRVKGKEKHVYSNSLGVEV